MVEGASIRYGPLVSSSLESNLRHTLRLFVSLKRYLCKSSALLIIVVDSVGINHNLPYHFNKEVQEIGFSEVAHVPTLKNISDLFTKAVDSGTIRRLVPALTGQDLRLIGELTQTYELQGREALDVRLQHVDSDLNNQRQLLDFSCKSYLLNRLIN